MKNLNDLIQYLCLFLCFCGLIIFATAQNEFAKSFIDDPVSQGGMITLEYIVTNFDRDNEFISITFTDDLHGTLAGMVAIGFSIMDICRSGSSSK